MRTLSIIAALIVLISSSEADAPDHSGYISVEHLSCVLMPNGRPFCAFTGVKP
jgi:hypothetical protein